MHNLRTPTKDLQPFSIPIPNNYSLCYADHEAAVWESSASKTLSAYSNLLDTCESIEDHGNAIHTLCLVHYFQ